MVASTLLRRASSHVVNNSAFVKNIGAVNSGQTAGTTLVFTVPTGGVPVGHTLIVRSATDFMSNGPTITDSRSNTYTQVRSSPGTGSTMRASIAYGVITTGLLAGDTITLTFGTSVTNRAGVIDEFSGLFSPINVNAQNGATNTSASPTTSLATTYPVTLLIGLVGSTAPVTDTFTQPANWIGLTRTGTQAGTAPFINIAGAYRKLTGNNTTTYSPTLQNSATWVDIMVAFKST